MRWESCCPHACFWKMVAWGSDFFVVTEKLLDLYFDYYQNNSHLCTCVWEESPSVSITGIIP